MPKIQFDVNVANDVAIDVTNYLRLVWWIEVYSFCFNRSKSLSHPEIKWNKNTFEYKVTPTHAGW